MTRRSIPLLLLSLASIHALAGAFYLGPTLGIGSTNWNMLTTTESSPAAVSSPIAAKDKAMTWGMLAGYQLDESFALEASYQDFGTSRLTFAWGSIYFPDSTSNVTISSRSDEAALYGKFITPIKPLPHTHAFAEGGLAVSGRYDTLAHTHRVDGIFGLGFSYQFNKCLSLQAAFQLTTGYGRATIRPAQEYVPFLYQGQLALLYHFS